MCQSTVCKWQWEERETPPEVVLWDKGLTRKCHLRINVWTEHTQSLTDRMEHLDKRSKGTHGCTPHNASWPIRVAIQTTTSSFISLKLPKCLHLNEWFRYTTHSVSFWWMLRNNCQLKGLYCNCPLTLWLLLSGLHFGILVWTMTVFLCHNIHYTKNMLT